MATLKYSYNRLSLVIAKQIQTVWKRDNHSVYGHPQVTVTRLKKISNPLENKIEEKAYIQEPSELQTISAQIIS